jgi:CheY-like chemotaxis protein
MTLVLIVDDSEDLQDTLQMVLTDEGFEVAGAPDGQRGLELTRALHPDVILLDMMMPEMDGLEFLARLSAEAERPPVVANSGFEAFRAEALRRGALAFLVKPVSIETLVGALRSAAERRAVPRAVVAENEADVEHERQRSLEVSARAVARLDQRGMSEAREGLQRLAQWIPTYFGFGTCLVHVLRGVDVSIEAVQNGPPRLRQGLRYPRQSVYCDDVIAAGSTLVLTDPEHHPSEHFSRHVEIEAGWRFYAGAPLKAPSGAVFGTVCLVDTTPHDFRAEDMRVLEALGLAAGRGLEAGTWPLDGDGAFGRDYRQLFLDEVVKRASRAGGAGVVMSIRSFTPAPQAMGLAVIRTDATHMVLLWGGKAGAWAPAEALRERVLDKVELSGAQDAAVARARTLCP